MTRLSRFLQVCCILAVAVGTFFVAASSVFMHGLSQDDWQHWNQNAFAMGFGMGSLSLGVLGLLTPWVNAMVFSDQRRSSHGGNS